MIVGSNPTEGVRVKMESIKRKVLWEVSTGGRARVVRLIHPDCRTEYILEHSATVDAMGENVWTSVDCPPGVGDVIGRTFTVAIDFMDYVYDVIQHGDSDHRQWLREMCTQLDKELIRRLNGNGPA